MESVKTKHHFSISGEFITTTARRMYVCGQRKEAIDVIKAAFTEIQMRDILLILNGKKKLTGGTKKDSGLISIEEDEADEMYGIKLDYANKDFGYIDFK